MGYRKGSSLLSRLSMIGGKKKDDDIFDGGSEISSEARTEGANATAFSFCTDGGGFIPHHKGPPRFIRVRAHDKKIKEFNRIFLAQELVGTYPPVNNETEDGVKGGTTVHGYYKQDPKCGGPIWTIEFSKDGRYLATGGKDRILRVWSVLATPEDRKTFEDGENASALEGQQQQHLSAPVFHSKPTREFVGHTGDILDLSWSKNGFLLSSSMDRTVRLWHMSRPECLCTFKHNDFVTSIAFHPRDDRFFLAGSLDATLRLWSIPDKSVAYSNQISDIITAVAFSPDGKTAIAGCLNGLCMFYETVGLKYSTQIHVRSSRGKNARGSKITGIRAMSFPPNSSDGEIKILVTSNDSRIRVYNLNDKTLEVKMKGHENVCNQIKASFSDDGKYIICGSEDRKAFIWSTDSAELDKDDKVPYEYFEAHAHAVTEAVFAPTETRQLLQASNDPVYTLCNPPPVMLLSKEELLLETESLPANDLEATTTHPTPKKPEESPAFIARSAHHDGNIIVTADHAGAIKVFRQDCAFAKRRHALESWDTGSVFSASTAAARKFGKDGFLSRTIARDSTSASASSRDPAPGSRSSLGPQFNTDRIDLWRHGVHGHNTSHSHLHTGSNTSVPALVAASASIMMMPPTPSERSISPGKPGDLHNHHHPPMVSTTTSTPTTTTNNTTTAPGGGGGSGAADHVPSSPRRRPPTNSKNTGSHTNTHGANSSSPAMRPASSATSHGGGGGSGGRMNERSPPKDMSSSPPQQPPTPSFSLRSLNDDTTNGDVGGEGGGGIIRRPGQHDPTGASGASPSFWKLNRWRNASGSGASGGGGGGDGSSGKRSVSSVPGLGGSLLARKPAAGEAELGSRAD